MVGPNGVDQVSPDSTVTSFLRPETAFDQDVIVNFCHHVLVFSSPEAGEEWIAGRPSAFLLSLDHGFELGRRVFGEKFGAVLAQDQS